MVGWSGYCAWAACRQLWVLKSSAGPDVLTAPLQHTRNSEHASHYVLCISKAMETPLQQTISSCLLSPAYLAGQSNCTTCSQKAGPTLYDEQEVTLAGAGGDRSPHADVAHS